MKAFDVFCSVLGVIGALGVGGGMVYVCVRLTFGDELPAPPRAVFGGLLLIVAAICFYACGHLLKGDLLR